jgi:hypothetical protein
MPILFALMFIVVGTIINGIVLVSMWDWFIVPVFHLPHLLVTQAIGIGCIISYLTNHASNAVEKERTPSGHLANIFSVAIIRPLFMWFIAWIIALFM